jgi:hypothetical protein
MYDAKIEATTETGLAMTHAALHDGNVTVVDGFSATAGECDTVVLQVSMDAAGNLPKGTWGNFNFGAVKTTTLSYDNAKLYFKPFNATVELVANGAVVATKENVSTSGVLVSELVSGVKVKGFTVTGVKLGTEVYGLDETVAVPCDCQLQLALEEQTVTVATPETSDEYSMRFDDPVGVRFKANVSKALEPAEFGWIVTRASLLEDAGIAPENFTKESDVTKVSGINKGVDNNGTEISKIFESNDSEYIFTAVLYFSGKEDDGLPPEARLVDKLIARPYAKDEDGNVVYGEPSAPMSVFDVALIALEAGGDENIIVPILDKCDPDGDNDPYND